MDFDSFKKEMIASVIRDSFPKAPGITIQSIARFGANLASKDVDKQEITNSLEHALGSVLKDMATLYGTKDTAYDPKRNLDVYSEFLDIFSSNRKIVRFKTAKEFEELFGSDWRKVVSFPKRLDILLGRVISIESLYKHLQSTDSRIPVKTIGGIQNESTQSRVIFSSPMLFVGSHMFTIEESNASNLDYFLLGSIQEHKEIYQSF